MYVQNIFYLSKYCSCAYAMFAIHSLKLWHKCHKIDRVGEMSSATRFLYCGKIYFKNDFLCYFLEIRGINQKKKKKNNIDRISFCFLKCTLGTVQH